MMIGTASAPTLPRIWLHELRTSSSESCTQAVAVSRTACSSFQELSARARAATVFVNFVGVAISFLKASRPGCPRHSRAFRAGSLWSPDLMLPTIMSM
ncbi:hypothetical protein D3C86_1648630 [compost metagenome]